MRKKIITPKPPDFSYVKPIIEFLAENGMNQYSIQIYPNGEAILRYGGKQGPTKRLEKMLEYLKKSFRDDE